MYCYIESAPRQHATELLLTLYSAVTQFLATTTTTTTMAIEADIPEGVPRYVEDWSQEDVMNFFRTNKQVALGPKHLTIIEDARLSGTTLLSRTREGFIQLGLAFGPAAFCAALICDLSRTQTQDGRKLCVPTQRTVSDSDEALP